MEIFVRRLIPKTLKRGMKLIHSYMDSMVHMSNIKNYIRFKDVKIYTSCDIKILLPKSTKIGHPVGIVVGEKTEIGENVQINQNVTIGNRSTNPGHPKIEDNVTILSSAVVLGDITLSEGCTIGANAVVLEDVGEGETVVGVPATTV